MNRPSEDTKVVFRDFDPGTNSLTAANSTNWLDMKDYHELMVVAFRTSGTGNARLVIKASAAATGASSAVVSSAMGSTSCTGQLVDASNGSIGNPGCGILVSEITSKDLDSSVAGARYVSACIQCATQTDEFGVAYIFRNPRYAAADLTATGNSL